ncbi:hypothetical protein LEP1GSC043_2028 [Leptospira weilii str. Ecochallenge]|uniref:Uncharacterized protein n=1 Tax=Leptospira weilii str. Ecochallenge TaxID=1049986 RepID=N1U6G2_9LEPT|nr:hypothetical protein LEP1GSC043_2028 [Leptospira weilii str. Ecochallenge]
MIEKNFPSLSASKLSASLFSRARNSDRLIFGSKLVDKVM